jgi:hypothetical protein
LSAPPNSPTEYPLLVGATIFISPTEVPIRDGVVLIQGEKIVAVGTRAQMQFGDRPGHRLFRPFGHRRLLEQLRPFFERKWASVTDIPASELTRQLQDMLTRFGFTSVFDIGSMWRTPAAFVTASTPAKCPVQKFARQARASFLLALSRPIKFSASWV